MHESCNSKYDLVERIGVLFLSLLPVFLFYSSTLLAGTVGADVRLVTRALAGNTGTGISNGSALASADGRFVVLTSSAVNLVAGQVGPRDTNQVVLVDRTQGTQVLVSHAFDSTVRGGDFSSEAIAISGDGTVVLYRSDANNLIEGFVDPNTTPDFFVFDRSTGTNTLVSRRLNSATNAANGAVYSAFISADGNRVLYSTAATDVLPGTQTGNFSADVFAFDRATATTRLVSRSAASSAISANGASRIAALSPDGRWVLFSSLGTNLVAGVVDTNASEDTFLSDLSTDTVALVSRMVNNGTQTQNGTANGNALSSDARFIMFTSTGTNVVSGVSDPHGFHDVFLFDRLTSTTTLVSHAHGSQLTDALGRSYGYGMSLDASWILFSSGATNIVAGTQDTNFDLDLYLYERATGESTLVSRAGGSSTTAANQAADARGLSNDGRHVLYETRANNVMSLGVDQNMDTDAYLFDRITSTTTLVSRTLESATTTLNYNSLANALSADGSVVLFTTSAQRAAAGVADHNGARDAYVFDRSQGTSRLASTAAFPVASGLMGVSRLDGMSDDGSRLVFNSIAMNAVPDLTVTHGAPKLFVRDDASNTNTLVTRLRNAPDRHSNGISTFAAVNANGDRVLFGSDATDVVPGVSETERDFDVFLFDLSSGSNVLVSRAGGSVLIPANDRSKAIALDGAGRIAVFESLATDLIEGGLNSAVRNNVFAFDAGTGTTELVSAAAGSSFVGGNSSSAAKAVSRDGRFVIFSTHATNLVTGVQDLNGSSDVYLYDRGTRTNTLVSHAAAGPERTANGESQAVAVSADGAVVLFSSRARDVVPSQTDGNDGMDYFVYSRATGLNSLVSRAANSGTQTANGQVIAIYLAGDGRTIAYSTSATDVVAGQDPSIPTPFVFNVASGSVRRVPFGVPVSLRGFSDDGGRMLLSTGYPIPGAIDLNDSADLVVYDVPSGAFVLVTHVPANANTTWNGFVDVSLLSADGTRVGFDGFSLNIEPDVHMFGNALGIYLAGIEISTLLRDGFE